MTQPTPHSLTAPKEKAATPPSSGLSPRRRRWERRLRRFWGKTSRQWRGFVASAAYLISALLSAVAALHLVDASEPTLASTGQHIPLLASLVSWTVVGLCRALEGKFRSTTKEAKATVHGVHPVRWWLMATIGITLAILLTDIVHRLNVPGLLDGREQVERASP